jgi:hypothetical protein
MRYPYSIAGVLRNGVHDVLLKLVASQPPAIDVVAHLEVRSAIPLLLQALRRPSPDSPAATSSPYMVIPKQIHLDDGTAGAPSPTGVPKRAHSSTARPSQPFSFWKDEDDIAPVTKSSSALAVPTLSELGQRVQALHQGKASDNIVVFAQAVVMWVRVALIWIRESLRSGTGSLLLKFDHHRGGDVLVDAIHWLALLGDERPQGGTTLPHYMPEPLLAAELDDLMHLLALLPFLGMQELPPFKPDSSQCPVNIELQPMKSAAALGVAGTRGARSGTMMTAAPVLPPSATTALNTMQKLAQSAFARIRNPDGFRLLSELFMRTEASTACSVHVRVLCVSHMRSIFASHSSNYLLVWEHNCLAAMVGLMDTLPDSVRGPVMDCLQFVVHQLHFCPFQELVALSNLLNRQVSSETMRVVLNGVVQLLEYDMPVFQEAFREAGMLDMVIATTIKLETQLQTSMALSQPMLTSELSAPSSSSTPAATALAVPGETPAVAHDTPPRSPTASHSTVSTDSSLPRVRRPEPSLSSMLSSSKNKALTAIEEYYHNISSPQLVANEGGSAANTAPHPNPQSMRSSPVKPPPPSSPRLGKNPHKPPPPSTPPPARFLFDTPSGTTAPKSHLVRSRRPSGASCHL